MIASRRSRVAFRAVIALLAAVVLASAIGAAEDDPAPEVAEDAAPAPTRTINMVARNWYWDPETIRVKQGTRLVLRIEGFDAPHAFLLKAYGIKVPVREGEIATVDFVADRVGKFTWRCGRPCGNGCSKMRGTLTVVE